MSDRSLRAWGLNRPHSVSAGLWGLGEQPIHTPYAPTALSPYAPLLVPEVRSGGSTGGAESSAAQGP